MLDYLDDIESDLSAVHRIDDMWSMDSAKFFRFARRLFAYKSVMRTHAEKEAHDKNPRATSSQPATQAVPMTDPTVSQYFEID